MQNKTDKIGEIIKELRKQKGMSQSKLADRIGVTYQQVQKYEKGVNHPSIKRLEHLAEILDVPMGAFLESSATDTANDEVNKHSEEEYSMLINYRKLKKWQRTHVMEILENMVSTFN